MFLLLTIALLFILILWSIELATVVDDVEESCRKQRHIAKKFLDVCDAHGVKIVAILDTLLGCYRDLSNSQDHRVLRFAVINSGMATLLSKQQELCVLGFEAKEKIDSRGYVSFNNDKFKIKVYLFKSDDQKYVNRALTHTRPCGWLSLADFDTQTYGFLGATTNNCSDLVVPVKVPLPQNAQEYLVRVYGQNWETQKFGSFRSVHAFRSSSWFVTLVTVFLLVLLGVNLWMIHSNKVKKTSKDSHTVNIVSLP